ncbi:protein-glutamine gamma-glutamyltransferase 5 [Xenopus laevis]|uniref:protein-glutamine gamma-glutamyltransferase n=2 Tax=Xenopus laevis TaxID=8355 RepID=A0A1L8ETV8_XENLA|nr:protein-glutamine gamma-glutamyltransferase 5 [Xenopus laevis]OCT62788.1 hypothetical protein XELAEV_18043879mg [Xenopus laevis]
MTFPPELSGVDFDLLKNAHEHRTQGIRGIGLVLRRGQTFTLKLQFRYWGQDAALENLNLIAQIGPYPSPQSGTQIYFPVSKLRDNRSWSAEVEGENNGVLSVKIQTSATAIIGRYSLLLEGTYRGMPVSHNLGNFVLLFNPWCPEDDVFLNDEALRQEYVMNEHGTMYQGTKDFIKNIPWNYGQFEDGIGEVCLRILDMNPNCLKDPATDCSKRGDPIYICRVVSAMINSNDDCGVVESSWDDLFRGGVEPSSWNGSVAILRQWHASGCRPVKYGQCWVFAGVLCTVMRFLGIPTRPVTNYDSAHDTNCTLTVDEYYDETGKQLETQGDTIWNFHVWNECWMARKDLRSGYDGWQVVDATPQEISGGTYCCGPAPVKAVKEGDLDVNYDVPFVYAEVNGDVVHWVVNENGVKQGQVDTIAIGKNFTTKRVGNNDREDVTSHYKYAEGSPQERSIFAKAANSVKSKRPFSARESGMALDFEVLLKLAESPTIGQPIVLYCKIYNKSFAPKKLSVNMSAQTIQHNGTPLNQFWKNKFDVEVFPNQATDGYFQIHPFQYQQFVRSDNSIRATVLTTDLQSKQFRFAAQNIVIKEPTIDIKIYGVPQLNRPLNVQLSFQNSLNEVLTNCVMMAEGAGLLPDGPAQAYMGNINPLRSGSVRLICVPTKRGKLQLEVNFSCNKIQNIKGSATIMVSAF